MASPAEIVARVRAHGANVMIDGGKLIIVNRAKLPAGALDFIKAHGRAIADFLDHEAEFEERAAIVEYDAGAPREMAEAFAKACIDAAKGMWPEPDRAWFIDRCAAIIDEAASLDQQARAA